MLQSDRVSRQNLEALKKVFYRYHGSCPVSLTLHFSGRGEVDLEIPRDISIKPCKEFSTEVNQTMGAEVISYEKKPVNVPLQNRKNGAWKQRETAEP